MSVELDVLLDESREHYRGHLRRAEDVWEVGVSLAAARASVPDAGLLPTVPVELARYALQLIRAAVSSADRDGRPPPKRIRRWREGPPRA